MATVKPGQVGDFNGKIGQVILTRWRDTNVGKSTPRKSTKAKSKAQLNQQMKFGLVVDFLSSISDLLAIGFQSFPGKISPMNTAVQYHLNNAITGVYPGYQLDYTKVLISDAHTKGEIDGGNNVSATAIADAKVTVSWIVSAADEKPVSKFTSALDQLYLVFYNITKQRFITFEGKGTRAALTTTAQIPRSFVGDKMHAYMFFVSPDGKSVSRTEQLGGLTVLA